MPLHIKAGKVVRKVSNESVGVMNKATTLPKGKKETNNHKTPGSQGFHQSGMTP